MSEKIVVYTACFGNHDRPVDIPGLAGIADLCCFTDQNGLHESLPSFNTFYRRSVFRTPRMDAKWFKMSATHLFPTHDWSIYIDASVRVKDPLALVEAVRDALEQPVSDRQLAFFAHPEDPQRSLEDEARFSMTMPKYAGEPCIEQVAHYRSAGMPSGSPLWLYQLLAGGCIGRKHSDINAAFEKAWFDECVHWSCQDQLSLPYVLWRQQRAVGIIPGSIYDNAFLSRVWSGPSR